MAAYNSDFLNILEQRGFLHQLTDASGLDHALKAGRIAAYIGFDATAPSLHAGSLMQIMVLRWLQKCGHRPIVLLGGGTTRVGDPSGKDESRKLLDDESIAKNVAGIEKVFTKFLKFGASADSALVVNNAEWLESLGYIDFLRQVGRHFSVNRMLTQDSVKMRLEREQNLSFLEFNYMVLQAYDFVELHRRYGCALQIGGSDQWGNIIMGIELHRRLNAEQSFKQLPISQDMATAQVLEVQPMIQSKGFESSAYSPDFFLKQLQQSAPLYGVTTPLLTTSGGAKMGKTAEGAVWLSEDMLPAYDYWQYWRNTEDADVGRFLRLFTELPLDEIQKLEKLKGAEINEAKKILANEVTALLHGDKAARKAAETAQQTFEQGSMGENLPTLTLSADQIGKGLAAYELFRLSGLSDSGGEARRLIRGGGAKINDRKITDENELIPASAFNEEIKLSAGRKRHVRVVRA